MPKFQIIQDNPFKYKEKISEFWREYLPGTSEDRLDWMQKNPAGPAIWLFAIEEKTGELAGTISLFPKDLFVGDKRIKSAIIGDLMVHRKFKVFGPTLSIIKAAKAYKEKGAFDFLYTIPNLKSKIFVEKAGFVSVGRCYSLLNPQKCAFFLERYVGSFGARILERPLLSVFNLFSRVTYTVCNGAIEFTDWQDKSFRAFFQQIRNNCCNQMTGDHNPTYLEWRYRQNPEYHFQLITYKDCQRGDIHGFIVFVLDKHRLELVDMAALDNRIIPQMLKKLISISLKAKCHGIYILIFERNPLLTDLKKCCFIDTKDQVEIYAYPKEFDEIKRWAFISADRNL